MSIAVQAPFNTTPAASGTFIPQLWSGKLNAKFYATTVFADISNTTYEGEIKALGDTITINNIPSITINNYVVGQNLNYQVPAPSKVTLNISLAKYFAFQVSDVIEHQSKPNLMSMFTDDATNQMRVAIDSEIFLTEMANGAAANKGSAAGVRSGAFNLGTDTTPIVMSGTTVVDLFTQLSSTLDEQNVPDSDRFLVIDPGTRRQLMASPLAQAYVTGDDKSILRNGKIGMIDRFTVYVSNNLPTAAAGFDFLGNTSGGTAKRRAIFAGHKTALTFASQIVKMENLQNPNDFGTLVRGLNIYGHSMIKPESWCLALVA